MANPHDSAVARFLSWGEPAHALLAEAQGEAALHGHRTIYPLHIVSAALKAEVIAEWLEGMGQRLDRDAWHKTIVSSIPPMPPFSGEIRLDDATHEVIHSTRGPHPADTPLAFLLLVLKNAIQIDELSAQAVARSLVSTK